MSVCLLNISYKWLSTPQLWELVSILLSASIIFIEKSTSSMWNYRIFVFLWLDFNYHKVFRIYPHWAGEMAHWMTAPAIKPNDLSSIPRTNMMEGRNRLCVCFTHTCTREHTYVHTAHTIAQPHACKWCLKLYLFWYVRISSMLQHVLELFGKSNVLLYNKLRFIYMIIFE